MKLDVLVYFVAILLLGSLFLQKEHFNLEDAFKGASETWGYKGLQKQKYVCPRCSHEWHEYPRIPRDVCYFCDITQNKDIDKYILKSSVPPCPNMNQYAKKTDIPPQLNMDEWIRKSEVPPCPEFNPEEWIRKDQIPPCRKEDCPTCPYLEPIQESKRPRYRYPYRYPYRQNAYNVHQRGIDELPKY